MTVTFEVPANVAPFEVVMAVVAELSRNHGAMVAEADMSLTGGVLTLIIPQDESAATAPGSLGGHPRKAG